MRRRWRKIGSTSARRATTVGRPTLREPGGERLAALHAPTGRAPLRRGSAYDQSLLGALDDGEDNEGGEGERAGATAHAPIVASARGPSRRTRSPSG